MADIEFRISEGPYAGVYAVDVKDISANDVGDLLAQHGPDLDEMLSGRTAQGTRTFAALVWLVRRHGNKGLAYRAVAEHINMDIVEPVVDGENGESAEKSLHPSTSADA